MLFFRRGRECMQDFAVVCLYLFCRRRSYYQKGEGWYSLNWFNPRQFWCLFKARTWISNVLCCGLCYVHWFNVRGHSSFCFLYSCGIVDHHCFNILFITVTEQMSMESSICSYLYKIYLNRLIRFQPPLDIWIFNNNIDINNKNLAQIRFH